MIEYYKLNPNGTYEKCSFIEAFSDEAEKEKRIGLTKLKMDGTTICRISTVFLPIDHSFTENSHPILFETMVFLNNGYDDRVCERYCTYEDAKNGHIEITSSIINGALERKVNFTIEEHMLHGEEDSEAMYRLGKETGTERSKSLQSKEKVSALT